MNVVWIPIALVLGIAAVLYMAYLEQDELV